MSHDARKCAAGMEGILEEYHAATDDLMNGLLRADDAAVGKALAARGECLDRYAVENERWAGIPSRAKDPSLTESIRRHLLCIQDADNDVIQRIESLKNEVGEAIVRIAKAGRMQRSYLPHVAGKERIVNGEG